MRPSRTTRVAARARGLRGQQTDGAEIAKYLRQVSGGSGDGEKVTTYEDGVALLAEGQQIDYDGPSGPITFDENGDPTEATIGIFQFADDNTYSRIGDG